MSRRKAGIWLGVESFSCLFFSVFALALVEVGKRELAVRPAVLALFLATSIPVLWRAWRTSDERLKPPT
jgi:hypothetical protein